MKKKIVLFLIAVICSYCLTPVCLASNTAIEVKPYKVETLANISGNTLKYYRFWIAYANDFMYYIDDNGDRILYSVNTLTFEKNELFKPGKTLRYNDTDYTAKNIANVFYDNNNDRIVIGVTAESNNVLKPEEKEFLVDALKNSVISESPYVFGSNLFYDYKFPYYVDSDNYIWFNNSNLTYTFDSTRHCRTIPINNANVGENILGCFESGYDIYILTPYKIFKYDWNSTTTILAPNMHYPNYQWAGNENGFVVANYNTLDSFWKIDLEGNLKYTISLDDVAVMDRKSFSLGWQTQPSLERKMYLNSHNELIFIDNVNYTIRKLSRNVLNMSEETSTGYRFKTNHEVDGEDIAYMGGSVVAALYDKRTDVLKEVKVSEFKGESIDFNFNNDKSKTYVKIFWIDKNTLAPKSNSKTLGK